jgi:hypothetical protein
VTTTVAAGIQQRTLADKKGQLRDRIEDVADVFVLPDKERS